MEEVDALHQMLSQPEVFLNVKREDVNKVKAVKLSDAELVKLDDFQEYLFGRGYIPVNNFSNLFVYIFNVAFTDHKRQAEQEAKKEVAA